MVAGSVSCFALFSVHIGDADASLAFNNEVMAILYRRLRAKHQETSNTREITGGDTDVTAGATCMKFESPPDPEKPVYDFALGKWVREGVTGPERMIRPLPKSQVPRLTAVDLYGEAVRKPHQVAATTYLEFESWWDGEIWELGAQRSLLGQPDLSREVEPVETVTDRGTLACRQQPGLVGGVFGQRGAGHNGSRATQTPHHLQHRHWNSSCYPV